MTNEYDKKQLKNAYEKTIKSNNKEKILDNDIEND